MTTTKVMVTKNEAAHRARLHEGRGVGVNINTTRATTGATTLQYMTPNETRSMRASGCGEGCSKTPKRPGARDTRDQSRGITQTGRYRFKNRGGLDTRDRAPEHDRTPGDADA